FQNGGLGGSEKGGQARWSCGRRRTPARNVLAPSSTNPRRTAKRMGGRGASECGGKPSRMISCCAMQLSRPARLTRRLIRLQLSLVALALLLGALCALALHYEAWDAEATVPRDVYAFLYTAHRAFMVFGGFLPGGLFVLGTIVVALGEGGETKSS